MTGEWSWVAFAIGTFLGGIVGFFACGLLAMSARADDAERVIDARDDKEWLQHGMMAAAARIRSNPTNPVELLSLADELDHMASHSKPPVVLGLTTPSRRWVD